VHAGLLAFIAEDDVWLAPAEGGRAWRLSAGPAAASSPRLSPDGGRVAWTGSLAGGTEIYVASTQEGGGERLTYWGEDKTRVRGWSPAGEILAVSAAGQPFNFLPRAHAISPDAGGAAAADTELPFGPVMDLAADGSTLALLTSALWRDAAAWKRYRGGAGGRMWIRDEGGLTADGPPFTRVLAELGSQIACPMLAGGRLAFLSDHEGTANIYSCALDGTGLRRHTDHDGRYARQAATDGQRIVYCCAGQVWMLDSLDAAGPEPVEIRLGTTRRAPRLITGDDHVGVLSVDKTGRASAVEVRGTVHWLTHRDGPARALALSPAARARLPRVLGSDGEVIWVTDADGDDALEAGGGESEQARRIAAPGAVGVVAELAAAPDGGKVAVAARDGRLRLVDIATGAVTELVASDNGPVTGLAWSPDSAWLAWSQPDSYPLRRLRLARIADGEVTDITDGRFADSDPVFSIDGKYLAFLSKRNFDPIDDAHFFDLSFPYGARPFLVTLAAATVSPFGPQPGGRGAGEEDGGTAGEEAGEIAVTVDTGGIGSRLVALPVPESRYESLRAVKGGLAWLCVPVAGSLGEGGAKPGEARPRPALQRFDFARQQVSVLADGISWFEVSGDGCRLVAHDHGELVLLPADRKADPDSADDRVTIDATRARFLADPADLWRHALGEAGRLVRNEFWFRGMGDTDWDGALAQYGPLVERVATPREFADIISELLGELGSSHAYVDAAPGDGGGAVGLPGAGLLGADLGRDADGWVIRRVLPGEFSDPRARSPLAAPGVQVRAGDRLLAVDGRPVTAAGPGPLLTGTAGKPVELTVASPGGPQRRVVVVPLASDRRLRYQDWVAGRRALVRELSGGRAGYLYVPDMESEGWADFHRDLRAEMTRPALIADVRGNGGGHISQLVVEKLARKVIGWDIPTGMRPQSYPLEAPLGPVVAVTDEFAGSDGDIVTRAIQAMGIGPVIGTRTWGGVIGIDGWHELVDGTKITVPKYAFWMAGPGWGMENYGVDPDIEVLISPDDWAAGRDTQLEHAVALAMEMLESSPATAPPSLPDRPRALRRTPLPPRS
jgi:tricorn protease